VAPLGFETDARGWSKTLRIRRLRLLLLVAMSAFGLWASGMVLVVYYLLKQTLPFCPSTPGPIALNCDKVLSSSYSQVFGIPLEVFAVAYFIINIALVCLIAFAGREVAARSLDLLFFWRFIGILIVPYLVFVEVFLLRAICVYCTIMHVAIVLDFVVISYLLFFSEEPLVSGSGSELKPFDMT
jgi:uncharacterized membrane protein